MATLLHIQASPVGRASTSARVAEQFLRAYRKAHPADDVDALDVWSEPLPEFTSVAVSGQMKMLNKEPWNTEEAALWSQIIAAIERFKAAGKLLVSCPMWNFSIPYRLKHYFDVVVQPSLTYEWTPQNGYVGLVTGRPVQLILVRAGAYARPEKVWMDHQMPYLKFMFEFLGFTDIRTLLVEPTLLEGPEIAERSIAEALAAAESAGKIL